MGPILTLGCSSHGSFAFVFNGGTFLDYRWLHHDETPPCKQFVACRTKNKMPDTFGAKWRGAGPWRVTRVDDPKEIIRIEWGLLAISSSTTGYNGNPPSMVY